MKSFNEFLQAKQQFSEAGPLPPPVPGQPPLQPPVSPSAPGTTPQFRTHGPPPPVPGQPKTLTHEQFTSIRNEVDQAVADLKRFIDLAGQDPQSHFHEPMRSGGQYVQTAFAKIWGLQQLLLKMR
jgi:hypothetical protein